MLLRRSVTKPGEVPLLLLVAAKRNGCVVCAAPGGATTENENRKQRNEERTQAIWFPNARKEHELMRIPLADRDDSAMY